MKIERKVTFEEHELNAVKTIAQIVCAHIPCDICPFKVETKQLNDCIASLTREMLDKQNIEF